MKRSSTIARTRSGWIGLAVPLSAWGLARFGGKPLWMFLPRRLPRRLGRVRPGVECRLAHRLAGRPGHRRRAHAPAADHADLPGRGRQATRAARRLCRAAGAARPGPRPAGRGCHPDAPELAVHVLGERAVLRCRHPARLALPERRRARAPGPRGRQAEARRARASACRTGHLSRPAGPGQRGYRRRVRPPGRPHPPHSRRGAARRLHRLRARRPVASSSAVLFFSGFSLYGAMLLMPLYYQDVRGAAALAAGVMLVPQGIGTVLSRTVAGGRIDRFGPRVLAAAGFAVVAAATVPFALAGPHASAWLPALWMAVRGSGLGAVTMPVMAAGYIGLDERQVPHASVLTRTAQQIGGSFGTAVLAVILQGAIAAHPAALEDAFRVAFWWSAGFSAAAVLLSLWLPGARRAPADSRRPARHPPDPPVRAGVRTGLDKRGAAADPGRCEHRRDVGRGTAAGRAERRGRQRAHPDQAGPDPGHRAG